jgi:2-oxoglutarate dehydrogenase E2 component (dihydrolipoamide succinyltransferase)
VPVIHRAQELDYSPWRSAWAVWWQPLARASSRRKMYAAGTFTISNHGVGGSLLAAPIVINQPQVAILGVGKVERRVCVLEVDGVEAIACAPCAISR